MINAETELAVMVEEPIVMTGVPLDGVSVVG